MGRSSGIDCEELLHINKDSTAIEIDSQLHAQPVEISRLEMKPRSFTESYTYVASDLNITLNILHLYY